MARVLIVDDLADDVKPLARKPEDQGCEVLTVRDVPRRQVFRLGGASF